jgi:hypothetical protein
MSWGRLLIVVLAGICPWSHLTNAQEFRSINQMPGMTSQDAATVNISNIGTAALNISYLDGVWKAIQIPSGQYLSLPCEDTGLSISFNDGAETKSTALSRGTNYALYWNAGTNRWAIAVYDDVAKRPSDFRPR